MCHLARGIEGKSSIPADSYFLQYHKTKSSKGYICLALNEEKNLCLGRAYYKIREFHLLLVAVHQVLKVCLKFPFDQKYTDKYKSTDKILRREIF